MSSTSKNTSSLVTTAQRRNQRKEAMYAFLKNSNAKSTPKKTPTKKRKKVRKKVENFPHHHHHHDKVEIDWSSDDEQSVVVVRKVETQESEIIETSSDDSREEPPVIIRQDFTPKKVNANSMKTPTKKFKLSSAKKKKLVKVLPLSPITPGAEGRLKCKDISFRSNTSFKLNQTPSTSNTSFKFNQTPSTSFHNAFDLDESPLAIPLVYSDDEVIDDQLNMTIISSPTQKQNPDESRVDDFENSMSFDEGDSPPPASDQHSHQLSSARGRPPASSWIENLVDRLDNEDSNKTSSAMTSSTARMTSPSAGTTVRHDSDKKQKYIKGGLATQLQLVLRQEKSDRVLFRHNINSKNSSTLEGSGKHLQMQIISLHKEGVLYVMECRIVSRGIRVLDNDDYVTVLLRQHVVIECHLQLGDVFTIYPPWKKMNVEGHDFPVLLCVNNITTEKEEEKKKNSLQSKASSSGRWSKLYSESLLEALERCDVNSNEGISIAATIQRIYNYQSQQADNNEDNKWTLLCEDAYGMFFELTIDLNHCDDDVIWTYLVKEGEGQRVCFERVHVCGRTTKNKCPRLFEIIASVWNPDGFGLHQIRNSQSTQDSAPHQVSDQLPVPNFAYRLMAYCCRSWHSLNPTTTITSTSISNHENGGSNLNRPPVTTSNTTTTINTDVLYRSPSIINISHINDMTRHPHHARLTFLAKLIHISTIHCNEIDEDKKILIFGGPSDNSLIDDSRTIQLHFTGDNSKISSRMKISLVYLVKDVRITSDELLVADGYSRIIQVDEKTTNMKNMMMINQQEINQLISHKLSHFSIIDENSQLSHLVHVHGVIVNSSSHVNSTRELRVRVSARVTVIVNVDDEDGGMKVGDYFTANCFITCVNHDEDDVIISADILSPAVSPSEPHF